jgi:DNA topoisomerase-3
VRLFIATKQSVARAIGAALAGQVRELEKREDHFRFAHAVGAEDWITWCGGRLLELAAPESYDPRYRSWRLEDLPIIPPHWQWLEPDPHQHPDRARQLEFIRRALKQAAVVVHAGDPDREGQALIDEILAHCEYRGPVQRLLLTSLNWRAVRDGIKKHEEDPLDNEAFRSLSVSARCRSRADWLYGMNMTRAYTLLGRHGGFQEVLSVGRVQTPLLALVVKRDESIESFIAEDRYDLEAKFTRDERYCHATLCDGESCKKEDLERLLESLRGKTAVLDKKEKQHHFQSPPLLLDLSALQIAASEILGYSAVEVINIARCLYEEYHLISYPMTDCRYAPEKYRLDADPVLEAVIDNIPAEEKNLKRLLQRADTWRQSSTWDDSKLAQHHGIIPLAHKLDGKALTEQEWRVYQLIVCHYAAQFFPDLEITEDIFSFCVEGYRFSKNKKYTVEAGWTSLLPGSNPEKNSPQDLPDWSAGDALVCEDLDIRRHKTRPPARFTEASLMSAMKQIMPYIENREVAQKLHLSDGLGTDVTRAYMMDTLFRRGYLLKGNKSIYSSGVGRDLIRSLPADAVSVDMTAMWERRLLEIAQLPVVEAEKAAQLFMQEVEEKIKEFIHQARQKKHIPVHSPEDILGLEQADKHRCPKCHSVLRLRSGRYGSFWGCSAYPACTYTARHIQHS